MDLFELLATTLCRYISWNFLKEPKVLWETISICGHSITTFALMLKEERGDLVVNICEQEGRDCVSVNVNT